MDLGHSVSAGDDGGAGEDLKGTEYTFLFTEMSPILLKSLLWEQKW